LDLVQRIWADDPLVQLGSPIAGVVRGTDSIVALYTRGFSVPARVQTVLEEIVAYAVPELVVFAGRERGSYSTHDTHDSVHDEMSDLPVIRSLCIYRFIAAQGGWRQAYHHVALDDVDQLARYQRAVRAPAPSS